MRDDGVGLEMLKFSESHESDIELLADDLFCKREKQTKITTSIWRGIVKHLQDAEHCPHSSPPRVLQSCRVAALALLQWVSLIPTGIIRGKAKSQGSTKRFSVRTAALTASFHNGLQSFARV